MSKALDMSSAIVTVLWGGFCLLKPCVMVLFMVWRAVTVECFVLKPCWCLGGVMLFVIYGRSIFSSNLAMGDSSEMGLYDVPSVLSLLGLVWVLFLLFSILLV